MRLKLSLRGEKRFILMKRRLRWITCFSSSFLLSFEELEPRIRGRRRQKLLEGGGNIKSIAALLSIFLLDV